MFLRVSHPVSGRFFSESSSSIVDLSYVEVAVIIVSIHYDNRNLLTRSNLPDIGLGR